MWFTMLCTEQHLLILLECYFCQREAFSTTSQGETSRRCWCERVILNIFSFCVSRYPTCQRDRHSSDDPAGHKRQCTTRLPSWGGNVREARPQRHQHHSQRPWHEPQRWTLCLRTGQSSIRRTPQLDPQSPQWSVWHTMPVPWNIKGLLDRKLGLSWPLKQ